VYDRKENDTKTGLSEICEDTSNSNLIERETSMGTESLLARINPEINVI